VMATGTGALGFYYPGKPEVQNTAIQSYAMNGSCGLFSPGPWMPLFGKVVILDVSTFKPPFKIVQ